MTMQLLALVVLASAPSVVSAASCSGLSTGAMAAIIVESVVIFLLLLLLLGILRQLQIARNKLKATRLHVEEYQRDAKSNGMAQRRHSTTSLVQLPQEEHDEESHVALLPPSLRPQSHSFSSPPSVRSSTLYDFTPRQEEVGFDFKSYRPTTYVEPPAHIPEVSVTTLPNPHSEHGHGSEDDHDEEHSTTHESFMVPVPTLPEQPSDDSETTQTPRPGSRAVSESSWAADVVGALERGPTPISRSTTATTTLSSYSDGTTPIATGPVHDLLLSRQRDSGNHSVPSVH
ncbi:hypothetical protein DAEQUDRAFT_737123 [Daedalea quercina L-15889]|uniref:Transmembrane protein n=1 Tax=Daedalea quercina L-15889 TaxID=1314783 RepID=A0A165RR45_9APHY|nr:hypothetical protein DAEQUDRAFT_737123 [Daedalea quercina L-15889]